MAKLSICPKCNGSGDKWATFKFWGPLQFDCPGCSGEGWVTINEPIIETSSSEDPGGGTDRIPRNWESSFGHKE